MKIYKSMLPQSFDEEVVIKSSIGTLDEFVKSIAKIDIQHGTPTMWYFTDGLDEDNGAHCYMYTIYAIGTGWNFDESQKDYYIGSLQDSHGIYVYHYFACMTLINK